VAEQYRQLDCLTESIYYEATGEPLEGMLAVAQVMVNRSESPKFQDTICKVIHAPSQFSWTREKPKALVKINRNAWNEAREVAKRVLLEGERLRSIEGAMFYHTNAISTNWDKDMIVVARLGNHIFYKEK
jgi:spore germination cell wall hydrolase CwlJ-like protein